MPRAIVAGGGLAGIVAGIALRKSGWRPVVYDAGGSSGGLGQDHFLVLAVNGFDALAAINAETPVKRLGFPTTRTCYTSGTGKELGVAPSAPPLDSGRGARALRGPELYRALRSLAAHRGVLIEHSKTLVHAETDNDSVVVGFSDGTTARGDILVGADGMHSTVRYLIDPGAPAPRATGLGYTFGVARTPGLAPDGGDLHSMWGRRGWFNYVVSPSGEVWWSAYPITRHMFPHVLDHPPSTSQLKSQLIALFDRDDGPARDIVAATEHDLSLAAQYYLPSVPTWHRDRMVIIGDAAHAVLPSAEQGVAQLAESAVILAQCLRDIDDPTQAFRHYESARRERVEQLNVVGRMIKRQGPVARVLRDVIFPHMLAKLSSPGGMDALNWLYHHHIEWDHPINS